MGINTSMKGRGDKRRSTFSTLSSGSEEGEQVKNHDGVQARWRSIGRSLRWAAEM